MSKKEKEICDFDTSSQTQGQIVGLRESLNGREKMVRSKVKNGEKNSSGFSRKISREIFFVAVLI